jgi:hypothetical protein
MSWDRINLRGDDSMVNAVQKAQDILDFKGETVDSNYLKEVIRELLVHIALYPTSKVIRDLEQELKDMTGDRDMWRKAYETLAIAASSEMVK